uniref:mitochondrial ubiquitin ligase activator of nfkb 1-A-like n=1 Tax=Styela clava TaxID=7725 RepID=UPI001939EF92|nr:mitochondrial ubiquitin ligase activator of nfkb 1-A-like [Styela clava]
MGWTDVLYDCIDGEVLLEASLVGLGFGLSSLFYHFRNKHDAAAKYIKDASLLSINDDLLNEVKYAGDNFQYVALSGKVQPDAASLRSRYFPDREGVIINFITEERKEVWAKYSHVWYESENELSNITDTVPFSLKGADNATVHVVDPFQSSWCSDTLDTINKEYRSPNSSVMDSIIGIVSGDRVKGYTDTEKMLQVGTKLLGIGELFIEDGLLKLKKPIHGEYILTKSSHAEVIRHFQSKSKLWKVLGILSFAATVIGLYFAGKRFWEKYKSAVEYAKMREELAEVRQQRQATRRTTGNMSERNLGQDDTCIICLTNPRECVILDCGHICACVDCVEILPSPKTCPICRSDIKKIVPLFHA